MPILTRRALLAGAAAVLVAGCSPSRHHAAPPSTPAPSPTPIPLTAELNAEAGLIALYDAALRAHPEFAATLTPIRAEHAAHLAALRTAGRGAGQAAAPPRIPAARASVLAMLQSAETAAATTQTQACLSAGTDQAGLLGSIAASEQSHLVPLGGRPDTAPPTAPGPPRSGTPSTELTGLQSVLAAQNAVRWGYDVVGGQVATSLQPTVRAVQATHIATEGVLQAAIRARHATPVAAQAGYTLPFAVEGTAAALKLAATLEDQSAASWHYLLGATSDATLRRFAADGLRDAAVTAAQWRTSAGQPGTVALPGT